MSGSGLHRSKYLRLVCAAPQLVIGVALFFLVLGSLYVWRLPNVYQSEARVIVDPDRASHVISNSVAPSTNGTTVIGLDVANVFRDLIVTTANLEKVAIENDLLLEEHSDRDKKKVLEDLKTNLGLSSQRLQGPPRGKHYVVIFYRDIDAKRSLSVLRSFLDFFLKSVLDRHAIDISETLIFLDKKIDTFASLHERAETELTRFRAENERYETDRRNSDLTGAVYSSPEIEVKFRALSRDYNVTRERHLDYVRRREVAAGFAVGAMPRHPILQIAEAPRTLPDFVEPNRPILFALIFIGACALGIAAPILRDLVRRANSS